jgi:hypothetical protein
MKPTGVKVYSTVVTVALIAREGMKHNFYGAFIEVCKPS